MYHFNKKQKIILGIIITVIVGFICYYVYAGEDSQIQVENNLEIQKEESIEETYREDTIFVHISGAVKKEGLIELKAESRISDAIDKARRIKGRSFYRRY